MAEYISKEELIEHLNKRMNEPIYDPDMSWICASIVKFIENMKSADTQPVKRGRWSECYTDSHRYSGICTVCGKASIRNPQSEPYEFCPRCGAKMKI